MTTTLFIDDTSTDFQSYSGSWITSQGTVNDYFNSTHVASNVGDSFELLFTGTQISILGRQDISSGGVSASCSIDGGPESFITGETRFSGAVNQIPFWTSELLSFGTHTLTVKTLVVNTTVGLTGPGALWYDLFKVTGVPTAAPGSAIASPQSSTAAPSSTAGPSSTASSSSTTDPSSTTRSSSTAGPSSTASPSSISITSSIPSGTHPPQSTQSSTRSTSGTASAGTKTTTTVATSPKTHNDIIIGTSVAAFALLGLIVILFIIMRRKARARGERRRQPVPLEIPPATLNTSTMIPGSDRIPFISKGRPSPLVVDDLNPRDTLVHQTDNSPYNYSTNESDLPPEYSTAV